MSSTLDLRFFRNHKDDDDMLRQMRTHYARSNRIIKIFYNCSPKMLIGLVRSSFVDYFIVVIYGLNIICLLFLRIVLRVTTNIVKLYMFHLLVVLEKCL